MSKNAVILLVLLIIFTLSVNPLAAYGNGASLYIDPSLVEKHPADVSTTFDVDVKVSSIADLYGFDLKITWDSSMITLVTATYASQLDAVWGSPQDTAWTVHTETSGTGFYWLVASKLGLLPGFTGTHVLITLKFHVDSGTPGQTAIHFDTHKLSDSGFDPITHTATDGTYKMLAAPPSAPPVGGEWVPIDKLALIIPWIILALVAASAGSGAGIYLKYRKGKQ
jgi:hypothetical protein